MVEIVSWFGVGIIALFAVVGFTGVVATSVLSGVRVLRGQAVPAEAPGASESPRYASAA
jgi:hypothetical protein